MWANCDAWLRTRDAVATVQARRPDASVTGRTAAFLLGLPVRAPRVLEFAVPPHKGIIKHPGVTTNRSTDISSFARFNLKFHSWASIICALGRELQLTELVAVMDAILGPWHGPRELSRSELGSQLRALKRCPGRTKALEAVAMAREKVGSPKETELRLSIVRAGLPEPEVSVPIHIPQLNREIHPDLAYRKAKLALEYEGSHHFEMVNQYYQDVDRYYYL